MHSNKKSHIRRLIPHFNLLENSVSWITSPCAFMNYLLFITSIFIRITSRAEPYKTVFEKKRGHCELQMVWHLESRHVFCQIRKMTRPMHAEGNAEMAGGRTQNLPQELYFYPKPCKLPKPAAGWLPIACSAAGPRGKAEPQRWHNMVGSVYH